MTYSGVILGQPQDDKKFVEKYYGNEFRVAVFTSNTNKDTGTFLFA